MPTIGSTFSIAKSGLQVQQKAMNVTAHNLANASTEGYARQRVVMGAFSPIHTPDGVFGQGVEAESVQRIADPYLEAVYQSELGATAHGDARGSILQRVEGVFGEPSETGLEASLDRFFSAFSELVTHPTSPTVRSAARQQALQLTARMNAMSANLSTIREEVGDRLVDSAQRINSLTTAVAELNRRIVATESGGDPASDLRDTRTRHLNQLAELVPLSVTERGNGSVSAAVGGVNIVDGVSTSEVEVRLVGSTLGLTLVGRPTLFQDTGGSTGGLLEAYNTDLPAMNASLDALAAALVAEVNAAHTTGTNPSGATGVEFFDPASVTASTISVSAAVVADAQAIAAGTADGSGAYRAGATDVAETIASLRDTAVGSLGDTVLGSYRGLVSTVGQAVRSSSETAETHRILADQAMARREALSGVSVDEELVRMIQFQTAYQASARVVTAADEMLQSLLAM